MAFEIRTDDHITTASSRRMITPEEAKEIHEWQSVNPSKSPLTVAVMDSGIDEDIVDSHPWFDGATLTKQYDATGNGIGTDEVGHGTGVASIIAKATPKVELYDVRIFGDTGAVSGFQPIRRAYQWLLRHQNEIDVVNMSWGAQRDIPAVNNLHDKLMKADAHSVIAAGNTGSDGGSPATAAKAFSVGAIDESGDPTNLHPVIRFSAFNIAGKGTTEKRRQGDEREDGAGDSPDNCVDYRAEAIIFGGGVDGCGRGGFGDHEIRIRRRPEKDWYGTKGRRHQTSRISAESSPSA